MSQGGGFDFTPARSFDDRAVSMVVYSVVFAGYAVLRLARYHIDKKSQVA